MEYGKFAKQMAIAQHFTTIEPGKILDFIDGSTQRNDSPEEYVRQETLKSLVREYGYPKSCIDVEKSIKIGNSRRRIDIAVYPDGLEHNQENIHIIIECKKEGTQKGDKKEGVDQLLSYAAACPNTQYVMWSNGSDLVSYRIVTKNGLRSHIKVADIPLYGKGGSDEGRPSFSDLRKAASDSLLFAFRRCHNYIAGNQGLQKSEAFMELLKVIFCKIQDERTATKQPLFFVSASEGQGITGHQKCFSRISTLFESVKKQFPTIFSEGEKIELYPSVLAFIVQQLQFLSLLESDVDVKGKAYEEIVGSNLRGDRGEFFTPRNICTMMVKMVGPTEKTIVLDPACGTGGFLITTMNYVLGHITEEVESSDRSEAVKKDIIDSRRRSFLENNIVGIDFNPVLIRATKMNMVMNNDGSGKLFAANSLSQIGTWPEELRSALRLNAKDIESGKAHSNHGADIIVTNPPFGSKIPITDPAILDQFELGHEWSYDETEDKWTRGEKTTSRPPEILFIERCVELLVPGSGIAAMVIPDGILGSPGTGYVRQWLLENTQILASIDMHPDTFQPGTSVQTSVLIVRRLAEGELRLARTNVFDYDVFMALCDHVGHDKRGNVTYLRDDDGFPIVREQAGAITGLLNAGDNGHIHTITERVVDDNTSEIAEAFLEWQMEQD